MTSSGRKPLQGEMKSPDGFVLQNGIGDGVRPGEGERLVETVKRLAGRGDKFLGITVDLVRLSKAGA